MITEQPVLPTLFYPKTEAEVVFGQTGPQPQFLLDSEHFKVVLVGLEAGQQIPMHPEAMAMYHFLAGNGVMTVNEQRYPVAPGATVIALSGARRGMCADTRLIFLAAKTQ
jgi:quercetin dioxygenase-like cupin family protein